MDVRIAPEDALSRVSSAINRRPKRSFGVLKNENEYVGVAREGQFEIWERNQHAVHALGRIRGRSGGSQIEVSFVLPPRRRVLIAVFYVLYVVVASGIALQRSEATLWDGLVGAAGAAVLSVIFVASAVRQRADLRAFVERVFGDLPRI